MKLVRQINALPIMEARKNGAEAEKENRRATFERRMSSAHINGGDEKALTKNALTISKIHALRQSVDRHNGDIAKLLLSSKETLDKRVTIEAAFRTCKEAFVEVSTMLMGILEGGMATDVGIVEEVKKAVNDIIDNRLHAVGDSLDVMPIGGEDRLRSVGPASYAAVVRRHDTRVHVSGGPVVDVPSTTSFFIVPGEGSEKKFASSQATKETVFKVLKPSECALKVNKISMARNNGIRIEAVSPDIEAIKAHPELRKVGLKVTENIKYAPRLIVHGIPVGMSSEQIREAIISQNLDGNMDARINIVYIFPVKADKHMTSCVVEVSSSIRKVLRENGRIYIRYSACRFADYVRILQCYRCLGFGHMAAGCKVQPVCGHCAENHEMKACRRRDLPPKCGNCSAQRGVSVGDTLHAAMDASKCPILGRKIKDRIGNINYG